MDLENDIADFLGAESAILYSQSFSTISSVIPAFCKRGDIIVADRGVNFAIQKGIQISRSTVRWFDHNDLNSLEETLVAVEKERKKRRMPLTRRFIVTEGIFQKDGAMADLPKLVRDLIKKCLMRQFYFFQSFLLQIELKLKYKYRLVLDESFSFGIVGRTGRGLTELYNVPVSPEKNTKTFLISTSKKKNRLPKLTCFSDLFLMAFAHLGVSVLVLEMSSTTRFVCN